MGEAFNNAVIHAYNVTQGDVSLTVSFDSSRVVVELADSGEAFDLEAVPGLIGDDPQESGKGLFIIRNFVDELTYVAGPPNRLRMTKRLPQPRHVNLATTGNSCACVVDYLDAHGRVEGQATDTLR